MGRQAVDQLDLEALEMAVRQQALQLAARAVEQRLNADTSDNAGPRLPCPCGGEARYAGRRSKHFHSVLGSLHLQRAYYHCRSCGGGFCPRDRTLGLENSSLSPAVTRMVGTVGALVSFQEGSDLAARVGRGGRGRQAGGTNGGRLGSGDRRRRTSGHPARPR